MFGCWWNKLISFTERTPNQNIEIDIQLSAIGASNNGGIQFHFKLSIIGNYHILPKISWPDSFTPQTRLQIALVTPEATAFFSYLMVQS